MPMVYPSAIDTTTPAPDTPGWRADDRKGTGGPLAFQFDFHWIQFRNNPKEVIRIISIAIITFATLAGITIDHQVMGSPVPWEHVQE